MYSFARPTKCGRENGAQTTSKKVHPYSYNYCLQHVVNTGTLGVLFLASSLQSTGSQVTCLVACFSWPQVLIERNEARIPGGTPLKNFRDKLSEASTLGKGKGKARKAKTAVLKTSFGESFETRPHLQWKRAGTDEAQ